MIRIDPLYLLLLIEACLILLGLLIVAVRRSRQRLLPSEQPAAELEELRRVTGEQRAKIQALVAAGSRAAAAPAAPVPAPPEDDNAMKAMINKLQRIVDYQKSKLLDLMTYIEILEGAQENLSAVQQKNHEIQERFKIILQAPDKDQEFSQILTLFEQNTGSLESYLNNLREENRKLTETFRAWEDELKKMWEEEGVEPATIDSAGHAEMVKEKFALAQRVQELEKALQEKDKQIEKLRKDLANLEQEYLILYKRDQETRGVT